MGLHCCLRAECQLLLQSPASPSPAPFLPVLCLPPTPTHPAQARPLLRAGSPAHGQSVPLICCSVGLGPVLMGCTVGWACLDPGSSFLKVRVSVAVSCPWLGPVQRRERPKGRLEAGGWAGRPASEQEAQPWARVGSRPVDVAGAGGAGGSDRERCGWRPAGAAGRWAEGAAPPSPGTRLVLGWVLAT